jgi:TPR repeat protein
MLAVAGMMGMLSACDTASAGCNATDWALDNVGLDLPKPVPLDLSRLDVEIVATQYVPHVRFTAAVVAGDYAQAQHYWDRIAGIADPAERMREIYRLKFALDTRGMYFLHAAHRWMQAEPQSTAAQLLMGISLNAGALQARGEKFSRDVEPGQMALFRQRFAQARPYLENIAKRNDAYAWLAHAELELPYFYLGEREKGWATIEYLIGQAPQYGWLYFWATEYAQPRWAGSDGPARLRRLSELAAQHRLNAADHKVLEQDLAYVRSNMENNHNPQAWRPYWERRQAEAPHLRNLVLWLGHEHSVENWPMVEKLASQAIEINPQQTYSLHLRSLARKEMGRNGEALRDAVAAAVLGNDVAMSSLIYAHIQGRMGLKPGDHESMFAYCKMGVAFGMPSAANCMGSAHTDGFAGVARDDARAAAWHLLAARGGHSNSQHDLGVLLPRASAGEPARKAAGYWMREAARQGHQYAVKKIGAATRDDGVSLGCAAAEAFNRVLGR